MDEIAWKIAGRGSLAARTQMKTRIIRVLLETSFSGFHFDGLEEKKQTAALLEESLFRQATSMEEYLDEKTLKRRMVMLLGAEVINTGISYKGLGPKKEQCRIKRATMSDSVPNPKRSKTESSMCSVNELKGALVSPALNKTPSSSTESCCQQQSSEVDETEMIKEKLEQHISSLGSPVHMFGSGNCGLCGCGKLLLSPTPRYCSSCTHLIKENVNFYTSEEDIFVCSPCFNRGKRGLIFANGKQISKATLRKTLNKAPEEDWVECGSCKGWQHQICGLYNKDGSCKYECPKCILASIESGKYEPSSTNLLSSAKDVKRTILSNHIEDRLSLQLKKDREERAKAEGKSFHEVPGADNLFVRVVLSEKKKCVVKESLLNVLRDENYPEDFPYVSKLILLFQTIDGVDVFLFAMYVQEYGSECSLPNKRSAYISYIDSVKYFTPDIRTSTGESLRTFAYYQIMMGYLDYIKKRGFRNCYLWSCPPRKGDEYILYCHPKTQKMPKPVILRKWYHSMIKKAADEGIVVGSTTLYDRFFARPEDLPIKPTAARLPHFDGDYCPVAIDNILKLIEEERKESAEKGMKKVVTKTSMKVMGLSNLSDLSKTDVLLMQKLEKVYLDFKEDFIVIDLQLHCSHCHEHFSSTNYWSCKDKNNYHLCERCHALEICSSSKKAKSYSFYPVTSVEVGWDTRDEDEAVENELCNDRSNLMMFLQRNKYQFDTLRRGKHSSTMILQNLRHLTQPTPKQSHCRICHREDKQWWSCKICPAFNVCASCFQQSGNSSHIHNLTPPPSRLQPVALQGQEKERMLKALEHANSCYETSCPERICSNLKAMFVHAGACNVGADHGCSKCQKVWFALRAHSQHCTQLHCRMPFCKILKLQASGHV